MDDAANVSIERFESTLRGEDAAKPVPYPQEDIEALVAHEAVASAVDMKAWDVRLAAILNALDIAREHGARKEWTSGDSRAIRNMIATLDASVTGEGAGVIPSGFGAAVRTKYVAEIAAAGKAAAKEKA